jgi:hypothetical protein
LGNQERDEYYRNDSLREGAMLVTVFVEEVARSGLFPSVGCLPEVLSNIVRKREREGTTGKRELIYARRQAHRPCLIVEKPFLPGGEKELKKFKPNLIGC